jgi:hypothetical protein
MLMGIIFSLNETTEVSIIIISSLLLLAFTGIYAYYLIRTGTWNVKDKEYSVNVILVIGLCIHFLSTISLLIYSQYLIPSKEESKNLLFTTLPFFVAGLIMGIFDAKQFYRRWRASRLT